MHYFFPVDGVFGGGATISWSRHNIIALLSNPKTIQLMLPNIKENNPDEMGCEYGFISYEDLSLKASALEEKKAFPSGFKKICWWSLIEEDMDLLVALTSSGTIVIFQCKLHNYLRERSWKAVKFIKRGEKNISIVDIHVSEGVLIIACKDGTILFIKDLVLEPEEYMKLDLSLREVITIGHYFGQGLLLILTLTGKIILCNQNKNQSKVLIDDGILFPGYKLVSSRMAKSSYLILTKFNRLYFFDMDTLTIAFHLDVPTIDSCISALIHDGNIILAVTNEGEWFELDLDQHVSRKLNYHEIPWNQKFLHQGEEEDDEGEEEDGEDDITAAVKDKKGDSNSQGSVHCFPNTVEAFTSAHGISLLFTVEHRTYPLLDKGKMHMFFEKPKERILELEKFTSFENIRLRFIESLYKGANFQNFDTKAIKWPGESKCPACQEMILLSKKDQKVVCCANGHFFDLCSLSMHPIPKIKDAIKCIGCHALRLSYLSEAHKKCNCGGIFLPLTEGNT